MGKICEKLIWIAAAHALKPQGHHNDLPDQPRFRRGHDDENDVGCDGAGNPENGLLGHRVGTRALWHVTVQRDHAYGCGWRQGQCRCRDVGMSRHTVGSRGAMRKARSALMMTATSMTS